MSRAATNAFGQRLAIEEEKQKARNKLIRERVAAGEPKSAICREFKIGRSRLDQILSIRGRAAVSAAAKATAYDALVAEGKALPLDEIGGNGSEP